MTGPIAITTHAWDRFVSRWNGRPPACFMAELRRLWKIAQPEELGWGGVVRKLNNGFEDAHYFTAENWRFVVNAKGTCLMTVERIILNQRPRNPRMKPGIKRRGRRRPKWKQ